MDALSKIIQNEFTRQVAKSTLISSTPCRVVASLGDEVYTVELITNKARLDLPNFSGSPLSVGENVQVFYRGNSLTAQNSYIGASLTKGGSGNRDIYIIGTKTLGSLTSSEKTFCDIAVKALEDTMVTLSFNANILGVSNSSYIFSFYINAVQYDYVVKGSDKFGEYVNCNVVLPVSLTTEETIIKIKGKGSGTVEDLKAFISGQAITSGAITVKEKSGYAPISFMSYDDVLVDWNITGTADGVGNLGINYLKQVEKTMPDGGYGIRIYASSYLSSRTVTFNSGAATGINFVFKNSDDTNISPSDVGTITISASGQSDIVINNTYQGGISTEDVGSSDGRYAVGYGDDGSGRTIIYNNDNTQYIPVRCRTLPVVISENTDYTITRTGGSEDIDFAYTLTKDMGEISLIWSNTTVNSIPDNQAADKDTEQWTVVETEYARITQFGANIQIDSHPATFENCAYFADLKAGDYKVIAEGLGSTWTSSAIVNDTTPYIVLIAEDGAEIIEKTNIFEGASQRFYHEEYEFTLEEDARVGLYFKALHSDGYPSYVRFMIVDSDVVAEPFTANVYQDTPITGVSCWEKYTVSLPITISCDNQSQTITFDLGGEKLFANDTISFTSTGIALPSYVGDNIWSADTENKPYVYIKYTGL